MPTKAPVSLQEVFMNMHIINTHTLTIEQKKQIDELVLACCRNDGIRLSYPLDLSEKDGEHFLLKGPDQKLLGILGIVFYDSDTAECSAFVHPHYRRQGYFSRLLDRALTACGETDLLFPVSEACSDTMAVLRSIGAELDYREHQMELLITPESIPDCTASALTLKPSAITGEDTLWQLTHSPAPDAPPMGACRTFLVSEGCVCLHQVEILPQLRGKGCGTAMLRLLLPRLSRQGIRRVILQVTDHNAPAMALYKKTGFRITETLSYYLY